MTRRWRRRPAVPVLVDADAGNGIELRQLLGVVARPEELKLPRIEQRRRNAADVEIIARRDGWWEDR